MQQEEQLDQMLSTGGIPFNLLVGSQSNIDFLICPICFNILWEPVACGQDRCFSSFCQFCINHWLQTSQNQMATHEEAEFDDDSEEYEMEYTKHNGQCPKCKRQFISTQIPIVDTLLTPLEFNCVHEGCTQIINYKQFDQHIRQCEFRKEQCHGCHLYFIVGQLQQHLTQCDKISVECHCCKQSMPKVDLLQTHDTNECSQNRFNAYDTKIDQIREKLCETDIKLYMIDTKLDKLEYGVLDRIDEFHFFSIFQANYQFTHENQYIARLVRNSFNYTKQRNDFLHFYFDREFRTGVFGFEWKIRLIRLRGNFLLGVCSSQLQNSIDFIVNKQGEVKKKESNENKYHHIRKVNFTFGEGDVIMFQYLPLAQCLRVKNESRHLSFSFDKKEIAELNESFYNFFSLEIQGDALQFF